MTTGYEGKIFDNFVVLKKIKSCDGRHGRYLCKCDCGNEFVVRSDYVNKVRSCGCLTSYLKGNSVKTHGLSRSRLYKIWNTMKQRCGNKNTDEFVYYGARGIRVCPEWNDDFMAFYKWSIENGYSEENRNLSIDRIDVDGGYEPSNCRWVDDNVQANNKTNTIWIEFNGEKHSLTEWAYIIGINKGTLRSRYLAGWGIEEMLTKPVDMSRSFNRKKVTEK